MLGGALPVFGGAVLPVLGGTVLPVLGFEVDFPSPSNKNNIKQMVWLYLY